MKQAKPFLSIPQSKPAHQRGASLLEAIAYLGIAALVVLGAVSLLTGAFGSAKSNQTTEEVVALRTAVHKLYTGQAYATDAVPDLVKANAIPNTLVITRGATPSIKNSWAGPVTVVGNASGTFTITYPNVPQDVCMSVISGANGWSQISGTSGANAVTAFPATVANATTICSSAGTNTIEFTAT
jgi:hypothetical protein